MCLLPKVSSRWDVPNCGTQALPLSLHDARVEPALMPTNEKGAPPKPSLKVDNAGVAKFGTNFVSCIVYGPVAKNAQSQDTCMLGVPGGGRVVPSMSDGR